MKKFSLFASALAVVFAFVASPAPVAQDGPSKDTASEAAPLVDYLIICADGLSEVAAEWAMYRSDNGRIAKVLTISQIGKLNEMEQPGLTEIKNTILEHAGEEEIVEGFQVLLLGDCPTESTTDYDSKTEIPWMLTRQVDSNPTESRRQRIPTDNFYADIIQDADGLPDIAVGRIPARTVEDARLALKKVKAYEAAPEGDWMRNLTFFAGEGRFGAQIDKMLESIFIRFAEQIGQAYNVRMTYANIESDYAYVPRKFSEKVIDEANRGAILLTYLGHGMYDRLDNMYVEIDGKRERYPILTSEHVDQFDIPDGKLPVMTIIACQTGYMDHAQGCLAEKICFTEKAPVAVIASSRDSHPYSNTLIQKAVVQEVVNDRAVTLGQAFMDAKRELVLAEDPDRKSLELMAMFIIPKKSERDELNRSHLSMYNLTGDPGLRLKQPGLNVGAKLGGSGITAKNSAEGFTLQVTCDEKLELEAEAWIECRRATLANPVVEYDKAALTSGDEKARSTAEDTLAKNHEIANDKLVAKLKLTPDGEGTVEKGEGETFVRFYAGKTDSPLAPGDYILKVFARDPKGERCGFAAVEFEVKK
ncbi:MAG: hypothetical protein K8I27_02175 [Planctomycetes bacterium]|nr:hypothetical protein [Planctomycetota bacterium]